MLAIKNKRGFSLIELVVVLAIISVLALASSLSYRGYRQQTRLIEARSTLGYIMNQSEAFKANTGFFLPNLQEMNISLKGSLNYSYNIICEKEGGSFLYVSGGADTCGSYTDPAPDPKSPSACRTAYDASKSSCWMGLVLHNSYNYPPPVTGNFACLSSKDESLYKSHGSYDGVLAFSNPCEEEGDGNAITTIKNKRADKFKIKDSYGICGLRDSEENMKKKKIEDFRCGHNKKYVMPQNKISDIYTTEDSKASDTDPFKIKNLLSSPNRLVITAIGCQNSESPECDTTKKYQIISISSHQKIYTEKTDREI